MTFLPFNIDLDILLWPRSKLYFTLRQLPWYNHQLSCVLTHASCAEFANPKKAH